jgi:hypothetical protein
MMFLIENGAGVRSSIYTRPSERAPAHIYVVHRRELRRKGDDNDHGVIGMAV